MVDKAIEAGVFKALADPTRRQILEDLKPGELTAGEIVSHFQISAPSISRHLGILRSAGLVEERVALCVGGFLSAVCPDQIVMRHKRTRSASR